MDSFRSTVNINGEGIRVICFRPADLWFAQGIERDICVGSSDKEELLHLFKMVAKLELGDGDRPDRIGKSPDRYFDMWDSLEAA